MIIVHTWTYFEPLMFCKARLSLSSASVTASSGTSCIVSVSCRDNSSVLIILNFTEQILWARTEVSAFSTVLYITTLRSSSKVSCTYLTYPKQHTRFISNMEQKKKTKEWWEDNLPSSFAKYCELSMGWKEAIYKIGNHISCFLSRQDTSSKWLKMYYSAKQINGNLAYFLVWPI